MTVVAQGPVLALSGGVGGAKLALGLADELAPGRLHIVANTADDFEHLGLSICPDIDTLLYTLAGRSNQQQGWGLAGESWQVMSALGELGGETWFQLGDRDLATHLWRSSRLATGLSLTSVTRDLAAAMGVTHVAVHPMSDDPVRTIVSTDEGVLPFQHYFVRRRCEPRVSALEFQGLAAAKPGPGLLRILEDQHLARVIICPSNPFLSVDPILQVPGLWQALRDHPAAVVAVSPIVAGLAIKGPAAKMMVEMGLPATATAVAAHYQRHYPGLLDQFVIDESDAGQAAAIRDLGVRVQIAPTIMRSREDKRSLARLVLARADN